MGQHGQGHELELTDQLRQAAAITVARANALCSAIGADALMRSGWRPHGVNEGVPGAAANSTHITCEAVDIADDDGRLRAACVANDGALLKHFDLYMEHPETTPTWLHVQTKPPRSGRRVYIPNADWAARLAAEGKTA